MGFLGGNSRRGSTKSGGSSESDNHELGPRLPDLGGTPPAGIRAKAAMPSVCPHCGKDPNQPPVGAQPEVLKMMFEELEAADGLSPWEDKFISDVQEKYGKYGSLTPKQQATLEKIHDEKVVQGNRYIPGRR